jgi:hypothetical protein
MRGELKAKTGDPKGLFGFVWYLLNGSEAASLRRNEIAAKSPERNRAGHLQGSPSRMAEARDSFAEVSDFDLN